MFGSNRNLNVGEIKAMAVCGAKEQEVVPVKEAEDVDQRFFEGK